MDESDDLYWHALNFRTAAPQHAHEMWLALEACVARKMAAERERCAKVCEDSDVYQYDDPGGFFANLIRNA